jgi:hypothetical protein
LMHAVRPLVGASATGKWTLLTFPYV